MQGREQCTQVLSFCGFVVNRVTRSMHCPSHLKGTWDPRGNRTSYAAFPLMVFSCLICLHLLASHATVSCYHGCLCRFLRASTPWLQPTVVGKEVGRTPGTRSNLPPCLGPVRWPPLWTRPPIHPSKGWFLHTCAVEDFPPPPPRAIRTSEDPPQHNTHEHTRTRTNTSANPTWCAPQSQPSCVTTKS